MLLHFTYPITIKLSTKLETEATENVGIFLAWALPHQTLACIAIQFSVHPPSKYG